MLLNAHTWGLHTIGSLGYKKVLNKQKVLTMFFVGHFCCRSLSQSLDEVRLSTVLPILVGPMFQFVGRWGYPQPGDKMHDKFENNKQLGEITAFTIAAAAVVFYR